MDQFERVRSSATEVVLRAVGTGTFDADADARWAEAERWAGGAKAEALKRVPGAVDALRALAVDVREKPSLDGGRNPAWRSALQGAKAAIGFVADPLECRERSADEVKVRIVKGTPVRLTARGLNADERGAIRAECGALLDAVVQARNLLHHLSDDPAPHWGETLIGDPATACEGAADALRRAAGMGNGDAGDSGAAGRVRFKHASDFNWIIFEGTRYTFTKGLQAESMRHLWATWEEGGRRNGCGLSEKTIGEHVGSSNDNFRLAHVFREHPAWETIICRVNKGVFALSSPKSPENHTS